MTATDPERPSDGEDEMAKLPDPDGVDAAPAAPSAVDDPGEVPPLAAVPSRLDLIRDVEMGITAELGRTRMLVRDILELAPGSVVELDRAAGSPVDVLVNGTVIARGEVVVVDEEFGIRITEVIGYEDDAAARRP